MAIVSCHLCDASVDSGNAYQTYKDGEIAWECAQQKPCIEIVRKKKDEIIKQQNEIRQQEYLKKNKIEKTSGKGSKEEQIEELGIDFDDLEPCDLQYRDGCTRFYDMNEDDDNSKVYKWNLFEKKWTVTSVI